MKRRAAPDYYLSSLDDDTDSTRRKLSRWSLRAAERLLWIGSGSLLVIVLSSKGSSDEASKQFEPAKYVVAADEADAPGSAQTGTREEALDDSAAVPAQVGGLVSQPSDSHASGAGRCNSFAESTTDLPRTADEPSAPQALLSRNDEAGHRTNGDVTRPTTPKLKSHVPAFLRASVESSLQSSSVPHDFDFSAARVALIQAANNARACPGSNLSGKAIVTFDPSGHARAVDIPILIGDGADRDCIARTFKTVSVPQFTGGAVAVKKDF